MLYMIHLNSIKPILNSTNQNRVYITKLNSYSVPIYLQPETKSDIFGPKMLLDQAESCVLQFSFLS